MASRKQGAIFQEQTGPQTLVRAFQPTLKAGVLDLCQTFSQIAGDHIVILQPHGSKTLPEVNAEAERKDPKYKTLRM